MRDVAKAKWVAQFDMEAFVSAILRYGTLLSMSLVVMSLILRFGERGQRSPDKALQGTNVLHFMLEEFSSMRSPSTVAFGLAHLGVATMLLTPYVCVLASVLYFAIVDRSRTYAMMTGLVLVMLTYVLFLG